MATKAKREWVLRQREITPKDLPDGTTVLLEKVGGRWVVALDCPACSVSGRSADLLLALGKVMKLNEGEIRPTTT